MARTLAAEPASSPPPSRRSTLPPISGVIALKTDFADATGYVVRTDADCAVQLRFTDMEKPARIVRFNPIAMWFEVEEGTIVPINQTMEATVEWTGAPIGPLYGRVIPSPTTPTEWCYQIDLRNLDGDAAIAMMTLLDDLLTRGGADLPPDSTVVAEEITEAGRLRKVVLALSVLGGAATIRGPGLSTRGLLIAVRDGELVWHVEQQVAEGSDLPHAIEITGYNSVYSLRVTGFKVENGDHLITPMPTNVRRLRRRFFRRCTPSTPTNIRFLHPRWINDGPCVRLIRDISFGGLSFVTRLEQDILFPGLRIPLMTIQTKDDFLRVGGVVRSMTPQGDGSYICGVGVTPWSPDDEAPWIRFVAEQLSPNTATSENMLEALWDLFEGSGYFSLAGKRPEDFAELRESFFRLGRLTPELPQLICQSVWPSERGVEGTLSCLKAYSTTWMGHQLAKRAGQRSAFESGQILRDVYTSTFERPQTDKSFEWLVSYVEPTVSWLSRSHVGFAERRPDVDDIYYRRIHMFTARCDERSIGVPEDIQVGRASGKERDLLSFAISNRWPRAYVQALDFTSETISMALVAEQWRLVGLERDRVIFAARHQGRAVAFGIFETGQLGTNLFRLMDCVRVISVVPTPGAHEAIIDEARRWYAARRRSEFLYFREDPDTSYLETSRLHYDSEPGLWIIAARHLPDFLEHVCEVAGPRDAAPAPAPADDGATPTLRPEGRNVAVAE